MTDVQISPKFKKLYARTLRLEIEKYLITKRCENVLIEYNVDILWEKCIRFIRTQGSVAILRAGYTGDHREAFGLFIEFGFNNLGWIDAFFAIIEDFTRWRTEQMKPSPDLGPIIEALVELGVDHPKLKSLAQPQEATTQLLADDTREVKATTATKSLTPQSRPIPSRPKLFIGSSREAIPIAEAIQANLDHDFECTIWNQGVFGLSSGSLEALEDRLGRSNFAVLIVTPDDITESRGNKAASPRDNVIFELGLFMGALGRKRTFLIQPRKTDVKIPSDLSGITVATYDDSRSDGNMRAATGKACSDIKDAVKAARG